MTHCERILEYMQKNGGITQAEAYERLGCARLGARIYDLKRRGVDIRTNRVAGKNRYGETCFFARYELA